MASEKSMIIKRETKTEDGRMIAFMNSEISEGYKIMNFSIQVLDRQYIESNPSLFKSEFDIFMEDIKNEAIANGWGALKEPEVTDTK